MMRRVAYQFGTRRTILTMSRRPCNARKRLALAPKAHQCDYPFVLFSSLAKDTALSRSADETKMRRRNDEAPYHEQSWQEMLTKLQTFVDQNGHARVSDKSDPILARWISYNRHKYHKGTLPQERIDQLETLGMVWNPHEADWQEWYSQLQDFYKQHGHTLVPQLQSDLGRWVVGQRYQYRLYQDGNRKSSMTPERIEQLNALEFEWEPQESLWLKNYTQLCDFRREHGHCLVPIENPSLNRWVEMNRYQYKKYREGRTPCSMTPERIQLLEEIDFVWNALDAAWFARLEELKEFVDVNGLGQVPPPKNHASLRNWLKRQSKLYKEKLEGKHVSLTDERVAALQRLGFLTDK